MQWFYSYSGPLKLPSKVYNLFACLQQIAMLIYFVCDYQKPHVSNHRYQRQNLLASKKVLKLITKINGIVIS